MATVVDASGNTRHEDFLDSSINIVCSLNEFRSVTFEDYEDYPIERFVTRQIDVSLGAGSQTVFVSPPFNALTVADEYQFTLRLEDASCGSLYEFADASCLDNPIVVRDGEIVFFDDKASVSTITNDSRDAAASNECPVIQITKGNLRRVSGDWESFSPDNNIAWAVKTMHDPALDDSNQYTYLYDMTTGAEFRFKGCLNLTPRKDAARLTYTSDNKWQLPLFLVEGYCPSNQMRADVLAGKTDIRTVFPVDSQFVVEIIEGRMMFDNHRPAGDKACRTAEINFRERLTDSNSLEQNITIAYSYESDREQIYDFDASAFVSDVDSVTAPDVFYRAADAHVSVNTSVNVPVNRIGQYIVSVKAFDAYNNTFVNEGDDRCRVAAAQPGIDIIVNQDNSENSADFCRRNVSYGPDDRMGEPERASLLSQMEECPEYPHVYKLFNAYHDVDDNVITYENVSYAIDTPKANDYILVTNMTEAAYSIEDVAGGLTTVNMRSSNLGKQNLYASDGRVVLCVYDEQRKEVVAYTKPLPVVSAVRPDSSYDKSYSPNGQITVSTDGISDAVRDCYEAVNRRDDKMTLYVINATEREITGELMQYMSHEVSTNSDGETFDVTYVPALIADGSVIDDAFKNDTVVKIRLENTDNGYVNETAFRVIDTSWNDITDDGVSRRITRYVVEGNIDPDFISGICNSNLYHYVVDVSAGLKKYQTRPLRMSMLPLHSAPVEYCLRVDSDASENVHTYGDLGFYAMDTTVEYNPRQLMFGEYFDDSYAASVYGYDPMNAKEMWNDCSTDFASVPLYVYHDQPVTVGQRRNVVIRPAEEQPQIENNDYRVRWKWLSYALEDATNWRNHKLNARKTLLFEVTNRLLTVSPSMLGSQSIVLECMDKYGNISRNDGGGNLFVRENED